MTRTIKIVGAVVVLSDVLFVSWVLYRASTLGINNVFSREHVFTDARPLTEDVAIELSMRALKADGHDVSTLAPFDYSGDGSWARVNWKRTSGDPWAFYVIIDKDDSEVRCRVYRPK